MADNTTIDSGTTGDTIATDDIDGVKFQRVKMTLGTDGENNGDVSATNPMPVVFTEPLVVEVSTDGGLFKIDINGGLEPVTDVAPDQHYECKENGSRRFVISSPRSG
jgi:hypothetical protein